MHNHLFRTIPLLSILFYYFYKNIPYNTMDLYCHRHIHLSHIKLVSIPDAIF